MLDFVGLVDCQLFSEREALAWKEDVTIAMSSPSESWNDPISRKFFNWVVQPPISIATTYSGPRNNLTI